MSGMQGKLSALAICIAGSGAEISIARADTTPLQALGFDLTIANTPISIMPPVGGPITFLFQQFNPNLGTLTAVDFFGTSKVDFFPGITSFVSLDLTVNGETIASNSFPFTGITWMLPITAGLVGAADANFYSGFSGVFPLVANPTVTCPPSTPNCIATWSGALDLFFVYDPVNSVPGPIAGAGLPGLLLASLLAWWRRKRKALRLANV